MNVGRRDLVIVGQQNVNRGDIVNIGRVLVTVGSQNSPNIYNAPGTIVLGTPKIIAVESGQPQAVLSVQPRAVILHSP